MPRLRTLGDLRDELARRLGFHTQGAQAQANRLLLESFVQRAQDKLWWMHDFPHLRKFADITVDRATDINGNPQVFWDWPADCDHRRIYVVACWITGWWYPLEKGIEAPHDALTQSGYRAFPQRWDDGPQLEIWPAPDQPYTIRIEYQRRPDPFTQPNHYCTIDSDLILLMATVEAKLHYGQPDAQAYADELALMTRRLRASAHAGETLKLGEAKPSPPPPMPRRI